MGLFNKKTEEKQYLQPTVDYTDEQLKEVEEEFDLQQVEDPKLRLFVKYYILMGGNGSQAYLKVRKGNVTESAAGTGANKYLRRLRKYPDFWDMLGLGYKDLFDVVEKLKLTKPEKAADIIMKVNKEDTERHEHTGSIKIEFERDFDG